MIYGDDFIADLYRPDPKTFTLRMASSVLQLLKSGKASPHPPVGFGTVVHWQVRNMVRLLQLHFSPDGPTIMSTQTLRNYTTYVPEFSTKKFGVNVFRDDMELRFLVDRKEQTEAHATKNVEHLSAIAVRFSYNIIIIVHNRRPPAVSFTFYQR